MKKVLLVLVLMMSVPVINGQAAKTTGSKGKSIHTTMKVADLKKAITDNIAKDYAGFTTKEAMIVTKNNILTYHVIIVRDTTTETLVYDKDGKFVKKLAKKPEKHHDSKKVS